MSSPIVIRKLHPAWFIRILNSFRSWILLVHRNTFPASIVLYERFTSFWILPSLRVAAELDIAGILQKEPLTITQLAERTGSDTEALSRMMRALSSEKIFRKTKNGTYKNTALSRPLADGKGSIRYMLIQHLSTVNWSAFNELPYAIQSGKSAFSKVYGMKIYDYLSQHPQESALFDRSMTNLSEIAIEPILSAYNFSRYPVIADLGGGEGLLLSSILYKNKNSRGILFDLQEGVASSGLILKKFNVENRVTVIPASFFDTAPAGADLYILKNIIHNWGDDDCIRILDNIRKVMPAHGKIIILEMILDEGNKASFGKLIDIQMMVFMENGKERTRREYEMLLDTAGLRLNRVIPTIAPISIMEVNIK
jgi:hypothetical protein